MSIAAGWYADPAGPGALRWWDGATWTSYTAPMPPPQQPAYGAAYGAAEEAAWSPNDLLVPRARSLGTRALVWGIVGIVLPIAFAPAVLAVVFGAMGLDRSNALRRAGQEAHGRRAAIAGLVLGGVSLLAVFALIAIGNALRS